MKRFITSILALILVFTLASCNNDSVNTQMSVTETVTTVPTQDNVIKIGIIESMSGENSIGGNQELLGIKFAHKNLSTVTINEKKWKIKLEIIDDKSSYKQAKNAADKLVATGVSAIIGSYGSSLTEAVLQAISKSDIAVISSSCISSNLLQKSNNLFSLCTADSYQADILATYAYKTLGLKKAYVLSRIGDDDSQTLSYLFSQQFIKLGGKVVDGAVEKADDDVSSLIKNAKQQKCDMIFSSLPSIYSENVVTAAYESKLSVPVLSGTNWDTHTVLESAWNYDMQLYTAAFSKEDSSNEFYYNIKEWINNDADALKLNGGKLNISSSTVLAYDAYNVVIRAITAAMSTEPAEILKNISTVNFDGISGKISFDSSGTLKRKSLFLKKADIVNDVWQYIDL
ncbi:MAG: ABC transporter substrate-binding protein [Faecalibacterium sp.]|nr:ABC transporter substrate-binding protein [Ruminococcus sp.]MCM1393071.1 ABC transporter substrate-binding protein [Ruminococcus sp.]MCM1484704.1 ABC transporter substrate-binding protein [Faecalibacterium sp.]